MRKVKGQREINRRRMKRSRCTLRCFCLQTFRAALTLSFGAEGHAGGAPSSYCGDLGGVGGSLLELFPGWGGGEAQRPAGLRASLAGLPEGARLALDEGRYVSLLLASPAGMEASAHFRSSPAGAVQAGLASLVGGGGCELCVSFTRWQISA